MEMTKDELQAATAELLGQEIETLDNDKLLRVFTVAQHTFDVLLNELERRKGLEFEQRGPVVPYASDYMVKTILTRGDGNGVAALLSAFGGWLQWAWR